VKYYFSKSVLDLLTQYGGHLTFFALNHDNFVADRDIRAKLGTYTGYRAIELQQWSKRVIDELPSRPIFWGQSKVFFG